MPTENIPFQAGMNLGRAFDLKTYSSGLDIFTEESVSKVTTTQIPKITIKYSVIKTSEDRTSLLDVSGELSLKVKAGIAKVEGSGRYLKESRSEENTLEIIVVAHVETVVETLTTLETKPGLKAKALGTHFIRSIIYGGYLIARIRIKCSDHNDYQDIAAKVNGKIQFNGVMDAEAKGNFKQLDKDISSKSEVDINYYSTSTSTRMPRDIEGMLAVLDGFGEEIGRQNEGKGSPITCELVPLKTLGLKVKDMLRDKSLEVQINQLEENYDDLLAAKAKLKSFLEDPNLDLSREQEKSVRQFDKRLEKVLVVYNRVIAELDLSVSGKGGAQFKEAFKIYNENKDLVSFRTEITKIILKITPQQAPQTPVRDLPPGEPLYITMMGKTGRGTSATGNTILDDKKFTSKIPTDTVRQDYTRMSATVGGRTINIVDVQGAVDVAQTEDLKEYLQMSKREFPNGFHVCLFVLSATERLSKEEISALNYLRECEGAKFGKHIICVFTRGDTFHHQMEIDGKSLSFADHIESLGGEMRKLLQDCRGRYILFNNVEPDRGRKREKVIELIEMIDKLIAENKGERVSF